MAVEIINSPDESTVNDSKKFTGVIPYSVIAINPTKDELHELGLKFIKSEPQYQKEFTSKTNSDVSKFTQIDVWLKSIKDAKNPELEIITKVSFLINKDVYIGGNSGKTQYVNKYGRTAWANDASELTTNTFFINEDARPAHRGEEEFYKFLFAWLNMTYDPDRKKFNPCRVDISKVFNGDYSELQGIVRAAKAYVVKVLTGIRKVEGEDGSIKYFIATYNKFFMKHNQKSFSSIEKFVNKDEYNEFRDADYFTYEITEFNPSLMPDEDEQPSMGVGAGKSDSPF